MFGTYRFGLAVMVATGHLWPKNVYWLGLYSVFCFYLLSGYLMTLVLTQTYGFSPRGVGRFLGNRALRIYPPYWAALLFAAGVYVSFPGAVRAVIPWYQMYVTPHDWVRNLTLLQADHWGGRWIPQSWSLPVEVWFYIFMALGLARGGLVLGAWLTAALGYVVWTVSTSPNLEYSTPDRYFPLAAAALPFALGSLACWLRPSLPRFSRAAVVGALLAFWSHMLFAGRLWTHPMSGGFYVSLALAFLVVVALHEPPDVPSSLERIDRWLGDVAYPLFLVHYHVAALVAAAIPWLKRGQPLLFVLAAVAASTVVSRLIHVGVERPIERIRRRVRSA